MRKIATLLLLSLCLFGSSFATEKSQPASEYSKLDYPELKAVALGYPVTASSIHTGNNFNYRLDAPKGRTSQAWSAGVNNFDQWIQVSAIEPVTWISVTTQGRGDADQ